MRINWPLLLATLSLGFAVLGSFLLVGPPVSSEGPGPEDSAAVAPARLAAQIPMDELAVVVRLGSLAGLGGAVRAGDRVDLFIHVPPQLAGGRAVTRLFLRDRLVHGSSREADFQLLTVTMPPDQVLLWEQAMQLGAKPFIVARSYRAEGSNPPQDALTDAELVRWIIQRSERGTRALR